MIRDGLGTLVFFAWVFVVACGLGVFWIILFIASLLSRR